MSHKPNPAIVNLTDSALLLFQQIQVARSALDNRSVHTDHYFNDIMEKLEKMRRLTMQLRKEVPGNPSIADKSFHHHATDPAVVDAFAEVHTRLNNHADCHEREQKETLEQFTTHAHLLENLSNNLYKVEQDIQELKNRTL